MHDFLMFCVFDFAVWMVFFFYDATTHQKSLFSCRYIYSLKLNINYHALKLCLSDTAYYAEVCAVRKCLSYKYSV